MKTQTSFANLFATDLTKINTALENTKNLVSRKNVNFSENGKSLSVKSSRKISEKQRAALQNANNKRSLNAKVEQFQTVALQNIDDRLKEANRKKPINSFEADSHLFTDAVRDNPEIVYNNFVRVAKLTNNPDPEAFALQFAKNIAILDENSPNYVAQKELGKTPEFISALAENRACKNLYLSIFFIAMCEGLTDLTNFSLMYYASNKKYKLSDEVRAKLRKKGARGYTIGTAKAQSGQSKKLARALGLIDYRKNQKNTPVEIKAHALALFEALAGKRH